MFLAHELILKLTEEHSTEILILWTLKQPWTQLEAFLSYAIPIQCRKLHELLQISPPAEGFGVYKRPVLELLTFKASQGAHGACVDVTFVCTTTTTDNEERRGWHGDGTKPRILYEQLTRAKKRGVPFP